MDLLERTLHLLDMECFGCGAMTRGEDPAVARRHHRDFVHSTLAPAA